MPVPRRLFTFWDGDGTDIPPFAKHCMDRFVRFHPDWEVVLLGDRDLPSDRSDIWELGPAHRADWLRIGVVAQHGGVWLDATCLLFKPVSCWVDLSGHWDLQGFGAPFDANVFENWAFAAPEGSVLLTAWFREFDRAVRMGFQAYCKEIMTVQPSVVPQSLVPHLPYLTAHLAFQVVRARHPAAHLRMRPSADGPFALHFALNWNCQEVARAVAENKDLTARCGCFCKLRGAEWRLLKCADPPPSDHTSTTAIVFTVILLVCLLIVIYRSSSG